MFVKTVPSVIAFGSLIRPRLRLNIFDLRMNGWLSITMYAGVNGIYPVAGIKVHCKNLGWMDGWKGATEGGGGG